MANSRKVLREQKKTEYMQKTMEFFSNCGEEVLQIKSNEFCFPIVDSEGNEDFVKITVAIPIGSRQDNEPFDGYGMAEEYRLNLKKKKEKAEEMAKKKAEKIKRDTEYREKVAKNKAKAKKES